VLSGMRPSGRLHLGNYLGALANWVKLQDSLECYYFVADWHALTDDLDTSDVPGNTVEMLADWLGAGLDPERSTLFIQSLVPEHAELHLLFSMTTPVTWLERVPTYRERIEQQHLESPSYGLLGYPLLQSADILMYKPRWVPVGIDQAPHVELTREVARRFNHSFREVFPEPEVKLTEIPKVPGTDGRKMSKSYNNTIDLADDGPTRAIRTSAPCSICTRSSRPRRIATRARSGAGRRGSDASTARTCCSSACCRRWRPSASGGRSSRRSRPGSSRSCTRGRGGRARSRRPRWTRFARRCI
jgi:tryptophanyl-tRNA synthetase